MLGRHAAMATVSGRRLYSEQRLERQWRRRAMELGYGLKEIEPAAASAVEKVRGGGCRRVGVVRGADSGANNGKGGRSAASVRASGHAPQAWTTSPPRHSQRKFLGRRGPSQECRPDRGRLRLGSRSAGRSAGTRRCRSGFGSSACLPRAGSGTPASVTVHGSNSLVFQGFSALLV